MEAQANGHTFMHPSDRLAASATALHSITLEEVNEVARELCEHLSHIDVQAGVMPAAVIACAPVVDREGKQYISSGLPFFCNILKFILFPYSTLYLIL